MSISLKSLKQRWVANLADGRIIGTVQTVYLTENGHALLGLSFKPSRGDTERANTWVSIDHIRKIGVDLIFIPDEKILSTPAGQSRIFDELVNMPVTSKDGRALGELVDIEVSGKTYAIEQLRLNGNQSIEVDAAKTTFGKDMILVQAGVTIKKGPIPFAKQEMAYANLRDDLKKQTTQVVQRGEVLVKKTSSALKRMLQGREADLSGKGSRPKTGAKEAVVKKSGPSKTAKRTVSLKKKSVKKKKG